jgi:Ca2+-binding EF-hand superfamily protein
MKKSIAYLAAVSGLVMSVSLAHAAGDAPDENMNNLHHEQMDEMMFKKLDTNGDGVISKSEFNAFNARRFKELDTNKDGKLTLEELQGGHKQGMGHGEGMMHGDGTTHLDQRFNAADVNHDGGLDREEAKQMPMLSMYFDQVDANKDGKVTRQEYFDAMPLLHGAKKVEPKAKMESM